MDGQHGRKATSNMQLHVDGCLKQLKWSKTYGNQFKKHIDANIQQKKKEVSDLQEFRDSKKKTQTHKVAGSVPFRPISFLWG